MCDIVKKVEDELNRDKDHIKLSKFLVLINECIDKFPHKKMARVGKNYHVSVEGDKISFYEEKNQVLEYEANIAIE